MSGGSVAGAAAAVGIAPLTMRLRGASGEVVGRATELAAVEAELARAQRGELAAVALEGEPGIGKSHLLVAAGRLAAERGFVTVAAGADEELRGPFLLARSIFGNAAAQHGDGAGAGELRRLLAAMSGLDEPEVAGLSPDEKLLRVFDLGAVAVRTLAGHAPLALVLDDLQWADDDSVRMLRYITRSLPGAPLFVALAIRPEEAAVTEAAPLLADLERLGVLRRLRLSRMTQAESADLLRAALGGAVAAPSAATMHAQAEGVPFILQEVARAYRDTGMVQQIDGTWTLRRHAERLVPSAVRTLIQRRAARLPEATRTVLAEAAVVGRTFSVRDLQAVKEQLGDPAPDAVALAELFAPAVSAGLLLEQPTTGAADYRFAHEQVQEFAAASLTLPRRRAIHMALVDLLSADGEPSPESLPLLARHALEADDTERAARYSIAAARAALAARAPEEVLRLVDRALPMVASPQDRVDLLMARDDALDMLRRPDDRVEGLAELAALTDALGDPHLELETTLRRAAAMRLAGEDERAADLAAGVRAQAASRGDRRAELHACLELGQAHLGKPLGESFSPSSTEGDLDSAEEAYTCACTLARELGDRVALAAATRELGVLGSGRVRDWYVAYKRTHGMEPVLQRIAAGEQLDDIVAELDVAPLIARANAFFEQAIEIYDEIGDRRGMMSAIIALAYLRFAPDIHLQASAKRIEEIRRLATQLVALSRESERDRAEAQMLYGVHVFARAKVVPDLAVSRGVEAYDKAHLLGDRTLVFLAAGGVAMVHLELGERAEADRWIDRAARAAAAAPTPFKARQLALWRGSCLAAGGDGAAMREQLQHAVELAETQRRPAASCEALAHLAFEAARLGKRTADADLLALAADSARGAHALLPSLPGHPLWGARADAALVYVALARDDAPAAAAAARRATAALTAADVEDLHPDIRFAVGHGLLAGGTEEEREQVRAALRVGVMLVAQRILDDAVRAKWFTGPVGRELTALVGAGDPLTPQAASAALGLDTDDLALLRLLVEGRSNREIADALGVDEPALGRRLAALYARTGSASRAEATSFALRERVV